MPDFRGKVALITGGTSGIGLAAAEQFVRQGAAVVLAGRDPTKGEGAVAHLAELDGEVLFVRAIKDREAEEPDICDSRAVGKTNNYAFDVSDLAKH